MAAGQGLVFLLLFFCLKNKSYVLAGYGGGRWRDLGGGVK